MQEKARGKAAHALLAFPVAWVLLGVRAQLVETQPLTLAGLTYLGALAFKLAALASLAQLVFTWIAARTSSARFAGLGVCLALVAYPAAIAALYVGESDIIIRKSLPGAPITAGIFMLLLGLSAFTWHSLIQTNTSRAMLLANALALAGSLVVDKVTGYNQALIAAFSFGFGLFALCFILRAIVPQGPRSKIAAAFAASAALIWITSGSGWLSSSFVDRGRFQIHQKFSSISHLDSFVEKAPARADDPSSGSEPCPAAPLPQADVPFLDAAQRKNLIFISIDTVRADDALAEHQGRAIMPALRRFLDESWSGTAVSAYPATMMSLTAAFTGLLPSSSVLSATPPRSVFGSLNAKDYDRIAIVPAGNYFKRAAIEHYITQGCERLAAKDAGSQVKLTIKRLDQLRKQGRNHVLWVHFMEPHEPYKAQKGFDFGQSARERYRSELAHTDKALGQLLAHLRKNGSYEDSLVFLFSDHGEAFGEHGQSYHHYHLYPWLVEVPFAVHVPGQRPRTFPARVHLTDIAPTALQFLGVSPDRPLDGVTLLTADLSAPRALISEEFPVQLSALKRFATQAGASPDELLGRAAQLERGLGYPGKLSLIEGDFQLIVHRATAVRELYDLKSDPGATRNLAFEDAWPLARLQAALDAWRAGVKRSTGCR